MNDDFSHLDERELKRRVFGTFRPSGGPARSGGGARLTFDKVAEHSAQTIICLKCRNQYAVRWSAIDELLVHVGAKELPKAAFCFTCKGCCMCASEWVNDLPPLEIREIGKLSDILALYAADGGYISFCRKCGHLSPMGRDRAENLAKTIRLKKLPEGLFYFTSEVCFTCSEDASIFVRPVPPDTLVRVSGKATGEESHPKLERGGHTDE